MENLLTDNNFWKNYWESKTDVSVVIPKNYLFHQQLTKLVEQNNIKTAIELGGFPGYYAVFLKKHLALEVTLLDYFIHQPIINELLKVNDLQETDVKVIEQDLFSFQTDKKYDLVLSCGLIEHFIDTEDIIKRHVAFLEDKGTLFLTLPNFHALNGWFQKTFDKENYDKHNLTCMNPVLLQQICEKMGLEVVQSRYFGRFSLWLENENKKPFLVRLFKKSMWLVGKVFTKIFPFDSKWLSPYLIVEAKKVR